MYIFRADGTKDQMANNVTIEQALESARQLDDDGNPIGPKVNPSEVVPAQTKSLAAGENNSDGCPAHPDYKGLRLGRNRKGCPGCVAFYNANKAKGIRETRNRS